MLFSELYSAYYNAVAALLHKACQGKVTAEDLRDAARRNAFGESGMTIERAIREEKWQLIRPDGTTPIRHAPAMPMTTLEKRWLKAISLDPRLRLSPGVMPDLTDVEPLFRPQDVEVFDRYQDGDPYEDEKYIHNFRVILDSVRTKTPLVIDSVNRKGNVIRRRLIPEYIEYSEKDDKMRLIGRGCRYGDTVNIARIERCVPCPDAFAGRTVPPRETEERTVILELTDERNALERVMMHFAHFRKQAEKLDGDKYRISVSYDADDETELVIRVLSFGPMVRVISPNHFIDLIKERLIRQKSCGLQ